VKIYFQKINFFFETNGQQQQQGIDVVCTHKKKTRKFEKKLFTFEKGSAQSRRPKILVLWVFVKKIKKAF